MSEDKITMELKVGDHDSLTLFGCAAQQGVVEMSKHIASLLVNSSSEIEYVIQDILKEIKDTQDYIEISHKSRYFLRFKEQKLKSKYVNILKYVDKMELLLKLQEVQILKEVNMVKRLQGKISANINALERTIEDGKMFLKTKEVNVEEEVNQWYARLLRKIEDLETSRMIALQNQVQLKLMLENSIQLVDQIVETLTGVLPVWREQIALLYSEKKRKLDLDSVYNANVGFMECMRDILKCEKAESSDMKIQVGEE